MGACSSLQSMISKVGHGRRLVPMLLHHIRKEAVRPTLRESTSQLLIEPQNRRWLGDTPH
jgi:hypothetical protein